MDDNSEEILADLKRYCRHLAEYDDEGACAAIEQKYGLYGYTPEIVTTVLKAGAEGKDMDEALDEALR